MGKSNLPLCHVEVNHSYDVGVVVSLIRDCLSGIPFALLIMKISD